MGFSILVCIKAVPDLPAGGEWQLDEWWRNAGGLSWRMNAYDAYALEAALSIKDNLDDVTVAAVSVGSEQVRDTIRGAMAMGADAGIHVNMEMGGRPMPEDVAAAITHVAHQRKDDLILTGAISEDLMQGVTGPMIAAAMEWPCAAAAVDITPDPAGRALRVTCELEGGMAEHIQLHLPAVVTVQTTAHQPRYPSLSNVLRSRKQAIARVVPPQEDLTRPRVRPLGAVLPTPISNCTVIEGTPEEKADVLLRFFSEKGWLK